MASGESVQEEEHSYVKASVDVLVSIIHVVGGIYNNSEPVGSKTD